MAKSEQAGLEGSALERPWTGRENPSMHGHRWVAPEGWVRVAHHPSLARLFSLRNLGCDARHAWVLFWVCFVRV